MLALYLADTILFSVVWAIPFGSDEVNGMIKRAEMILTDYDNFNTTLLNGLIVKKDIIKNNRYIN